MTEQNLIHFKMKCSECKREITDGMIYYHDKEKGFICECCPGFEKGGISIVDPEEGDDE